MDAARVREHLPSAIEELPPLGRAVLQADLHAGVDAHPVHLARATGMDDASALCTERLSAEEAVIRRLAPRGPRGLDPARRRGDPRGLRALEPVRPDARGGGPRARPGRARARSADGRGAGRDRPLVLRARGAVGTRGARGHPVPALRGARGGRADGDHLAVAGRRPGPRARLGLFCENLLGDQMPKAEALWEAKQELRRGEFEKSDWAAWVLSGDPE